MPKEKTLFSNLSDDVALWREGGYQCADFPLIGEILKFQYISEQGENLRYLRAAQFAALETYWYLRLKENTPHIMALYKKYYPQPLKFAKALGIRFSEEDLIQINNVDDIIAKIRDPQWMRGRSLDAVHEAAILEYPSYILALAMGAGKTILIGAIIATEFAMAIRYGGGGGNIRFMQNALIFAPGLTIIESLREIAEMPMAEILPPALFREYAVNVKIEYARSNQKEIPVQAGSCYNIIISNSERIRLRAHTRRNKNQSEIQFAQRNERANLEANARLAKIASLPNLGMFSDEAHHTYGNAAGDELKRVRETVNYIDEKTKLVAVVNTSGTPYYKKQILAEVVCWYGLGQGMRDGILKTLDTHSYFLGDSGQPEDAVVNDIIGKFFNEYKDTRLPNGARAKIAFYFKTQEHLDESRPFIEDAMIQIREDTTQILVNTQQSSKAEKDEFNRLNHPDSQKRVILLVQIGVEGWNCPSLFACAVIKKQTQPVFVLQAATRCLRQTEGNRQGALIFLSDANRRILEKAVHENFGVRLGAIEGINSTVVPVDIKIRKTNLPDLRITRKIRRVEREELPDNPVKLTRPRKAQVSSEITVQSGSLDWESLRILQFDGNETIPLREVSLDCYTAAARIAANYHLPVMPILQQLQELYPEREIPGAHFTALLQQVQKQTANYRETTETIEEVLALIKIMDENGNCLEQDGDGCFVHRLYFSDREFERMVNNGLIVSNEGGGDENSRSDKHNLSYHYTPYCFDSAPEGAFFSGVLSALNTEKDDIQAFIFTGHASTRLTDFYFYYNGEDGNLHHYFPDFLLLKKSGEFFAVEIKGRNTPDPNVEVKRKAVEVLTEMPENNFRYAVIYADGNNISPNEENYSEVREWIWGEEL